MKKISAFFLALALCLGLAVPAFAADSSAEVYTYISAASGSEYPYVNHELEYQFRTVDSAYKLGEAQKDKDVLAVVPTSEYFRVGVYNMGKDEENAIIMQAFSDPDGDGVYDQRLFTLDLQKNEVGVLPVPENGAYNTTLPNKTLLNAVELPGFDKQGDGDYAFSAARLHEFFGDNTLIFFYSGQKYVGGVLLSEGAFGDVPGLGWYADTVAWAADKGIARGFEDGNYVPGDDCTQSQILTFLWRAEGKPEAAKAPVTVEEWYQDAVNWAYEKGMIDDSFEGDKPCTRATAVQYIWQAKGEPSAPSSSFNDMKGYEDYAKAVDWAADKGVTRGSGDGTFEPGKTCNRAEIATFLYRAYN